MNITSFLAPNRLTLEDGSVLLEYHALGSTMDTARARVQVGERRVIGVRADYQSAGRGRQGAAWLAPPGSCLLVTYILYGDDCRPENAGYLAFMAAVAVADALESLTELSPAFKWPNDVLLTDRKVAGILIETVPALENPKSKIQNPYAALVGIGLNVNIDRFPPELEPTATSLEQETGLLWDVSTLEEAVRTRLFAARAVPWDDLLRHWRARDATAGRRFRATVDGHEIVGVAEGVGTGGALRLRTEAGQVVEVLSATWMRDAR